jgi:glycosyltransferase involved in cell wall biosynthesis
LDTYDVVVSVAVITYGQEKTIRQALDSILMQKVNFKYEIVIGEDCSPDHTRDILMEYKEKYPDKIKLILQHKNVGTVKNIISVYKQCVGKYIAILEGDDYWIDENKLQIQVDFLDNNSDFSATFTDAKVMDETNRVTCLMRVKNNNVYDMESFFEDTRYIPTCTFMFRGNILRENNYYPYFMTTKFVTDVIMHVICLRHGHLKFINKKTAIYRYVVRNSTSFSSLPLEEKKYDSMQARRMQIQLINEKKAYKSAYKMLTIKQVGLLYLYYDNGHYKKMIYFFMKDLNIVEKFLVISWFWNNSVVNKRSM